MKIADTGLCYDRIFAFTDTSLRSLYRWTASCTLKMDLVCPRKVWLSTTKLMSRTWKIKRTTRRFLASYFHSSPCTCREEHIFDARTELEAAPSRFCVCHWNMLGCLTPCVTCSCQLRLPLQLSPASCTVYFTLSKSDNRDG